MKQNSIVANLVSRFTSGSSAGPESSEALSNLQAEFDAFKAEAEASQAALAESLTEALEAVSKLEAERDALLADLESAKEFAAHKAQEEAQSKLQARKSRIEATVGSNRADAVLQATEGMDDAQFEAVMTVMAAAGEAEASSPLFTAVGVSADVNPASVNPTETKEMQILRSRYPKKD